MPRLYVTATQGGNDVFAQGTVQTGLEGQIRQAYRINEIGYELILPQAAYLPRPAAAGQKLEFSLARRTKAAMPNMGDSDVMKKWAWSGSWQTLVGSSPSFPSLDSWRPQGDPLLVVEPTLYAQISSSGTATTWSTIMWIDFDIVTISEVDRLTLLTQSLQ